MKRIEKSGQKLIWRKYDLFLQLEPWGPDAIRVRATRNRTLPSENEVLLSPEAVSAEVVCQKEVENDMGLATGITDLDTLGSDIDGYIVNGAITVETGESVLTFKNTYTGDIVLQGKELIICAGEGQAITGALTSKSADKYEAKVEFSAYEEERIYGMGQHRHGFLNQKGCVLDLFHHNCEINIPFALSSRGYGFIWNNPSVGRAEFGRTRTLWTAEVTEAIDYVVIAHKDPAVIVSKYVKLTGYAPTFPQWASGFWQCKLRYSSQQEVLAVAREYQKRELPISAIVVDFMHWTHSGDWQFDPKFWPDPKAMVEELTSMGIETVVSVWPTVSKNSKNFGMMMKNGMLVGANHGVPVMLSFMDTGEADWEAMYLVDSTNPETRDFVWQQLKENYYDLGIKTFWLDAIEPELISHFPDYTHIRYHIGDASETTGLYPWCMQKMCSDGLLDIGESDILTLGRSGFLGSQRFGAAIWNGDIKSSFEMLEVSVRAGLNMALSGISWWATDIGGFHGGDTGSDYFRELIVRWFQYAVFCPIFRLHGFRLNDADNEVWSFGEEAYAQIRTCLEMRERLRPYLHEQMELYSKTGMPVMRPLFLDFPEDTAAWKIENQYLFGPDILVVPITQLGSVSIRVYLPEGADWTYVPLQKTYDGGQWIEVDTPMDYIPVFTKGSNSIF